MPKLTALFSAVDQMSGQIDRISQSGLSMVEQFERAGDTANRAMSAIDGAASSAAASIADAAAQADYWTAAAGNYNREAMEAIYTTEELVEAGYKSADALAEQEEMLDLCEKSATGLSRAIEAATGIQTDLSAALDRANEVTADLAKNEGVSAETKSELARASIAATEAMNELTAAQEEAAAAMENYDAVMMSGTTDLEELEAAAERACHAGEALAEANGKASDATAELSRATDNAVEEAEEAERSGVKAVQGIAGALAAAGITAMVKETAEAVYDLANAYSEAEKIVVNATGATGAQLDSLGTSMLEAWAGNDDPLNDVAAAVGEINTRLGYTGERLTTTTGLFLDFADITGGNASASVRQVTQLMNQWNVEATNMEHVMDILAYAGQASGAGVGTLTQQLTTNKAILDQLGFSLEQSIALLMQFELSGTNATQVMTGFRTALSKGDVSSLEELYEIFDQIASGAMTAADASDMFGSRAGAAIVNAVNNGVLSLDTLESALDSADGTLQRTAAAGESLEEKWQKAQNNISSAFTSELQPALDRVSSGFADLANSAGDFLNENPAVTKGVIALGVGFGATAVGIAGVSAASLTAIPAVAALGTAISAAIWPITAVAAAIAAVTAAALFLKDALVEDLGEVEGMTAVTREQYYELQNLNDEYERAAEEYGATSEEALRLKYQVDDLTVAFESNRQTVEEFTNEVNSLIESHDNLVSSYKEGIETVDQNGVGVLSLVQKLEDLSSQTERTAAQEEQMKAVIDQLNSELPDLSLSYDDVTGSAESFADALKRTVEAQVEQERHDEQKQAYVNLLKEQAVLEDEIAKTEENIRLEQERMDDMGALKHIFTIGEKDDLKAYETALEDLNATYAENQAVMQSIEQEWENVSAAADEAEGQTLSYEEAVATAYDQVQSEVEELCAAYDEAYQAAAESFAGQFWLFDEAQADMEATVENAQAALDSQLSYWEGYAANIETLRSISAEDLGVTQENYAALMSYVQDGSEQAAGLAQSMVEAINSGDTESLSHLAETVGEINTKQSEVATATADWVTNFSAEMDGIEQRMDEAVSNLNLSSEAEESATQTINSYTSAIRSGGSSAVTAAQEVARSVAAALSSARLSFGINLSGGVTGHANGTTNAESIFIAGEEGPELIVPRAAAYATGTTDSDDVFIAGDNGPELIVGRQGSTVFPAGETDRIINALRERQEMRPVLRSGSNNGRGAAQEKRILLEISGSGAINVGGGGIDREGVLSIIQDHLKPILMNIIQQEIYEEGELSYEY